MANVIYNSFKSRLFTSNLGGLNWPSTTVNVMLLNNTYVTPSVSGAEDNHIFRSDVASYEVSGAGYTTGGMPLPSRTISTNPSTNTITLSSGNATWSASTITNAQFAVLYIPNGGPGSDILIAAYDFGSPKSSSNDNFTFTVNASGLLTLS